MPRSNILQRLTAAPILRPVSQAAFQILGKNAFDLAVREVVLWMRERNREIPESALKGEPFRSVAGAVYPSEAVFLESDGPRLWAATLEDTRDQRDFGRTWVTEVTVGEHDGRAAFSARLSLVLRDGESPFFASRPGCVPRVLSKLIASSDSFRLLEVPIEVDTDDEINDFIKLLVDKNRRLPVVALSAIDGAYGVDAEKLATRVSGLAHVMTLTDRASWQLTHSFGKSNSTFLGATRIYRTKFDPVDGNPYDNPLWLIGDNSYPSRMQRLNQITTQVAFASLSAFTGSDALPRYDEVRRAAAQAIVIRARESGAGDRDLLDLYEQENERLREALSKQKAEHDDAMQLASDELTKAESVRDEALAERAAMRARVVSLEAALAERGQAIQADPLTSFEDIEDWCERNLVGSIWVARKAVREAEKNGHFEDPELFGKSLLLLRDLFVPMKANPGAERYEAYQNALRELGLTDEPCFSQRGSIKAYPEYKVTYDGDEYWCENHIKYGGGTDPTKFFRIYYHWHDSKGILLIGYMPTHLDNKLTN